MRMMRVPAFLLLLPLLLLVGPGCETFTISAEAGLAEFEMEGSISNTLTPATTNGMNNLSNAFGIDDPEDIPYIRATGDLGPVTFSCAGFDMEAEGTGTLEANFGSLPASATVATDISLTSLRGSCYFLDLGDLLPGDAFDLKLGLGIDYFDLRIQAESTSPAVTEEIEAQVPMPIGCVMAGVDFNSFEVVLEGGFFSVPSGYTDQYKGTFFDLEGMVKFHPLPNLTLFVGYRYIGLDGEGEEDNNEYEVDITIEGWVVGGGLKF